jgi:hypothetical protein
MSTSADDLVEIPEEMQEITREEAEANPQLRADPSMATEGVLDHEDPAKFEELEMAAAEEILAEEEDDPTRGPAPISPHQRRALRLAVTQKGVRETPPGSNRNPYSKYFGFGPQFWCADFVAWALDRTGNRDKRVPWGYPSAVENITAWGQARGLIHSQPRKGDIFTYKNGKHTGFVLKADGSSFISIEGNTGGPVGTVYVASHARDASDGTYFFVRHSF